MVFVNTYSIWWSESSIDLMNFGLRRNYHTYVCHPLPGAKAIWVHSFTSSSQHRSTPSIGGTAAPSQIERQQVASPHMRANSAMGEISTCISHIPACTNPAGSLSKMRPKTEPEPSTATIFDSDTRRLPQITCEWHLWKACPSLMLDEPIQLSSLSGWSVHGTTCISTMYIWTTKPQQKRKIGCRKKQVLNPFLRNQSCLRIGQDWSDFNPLFWHCREEIRQILIET